MANTIRIRIISPNGVLFEGDVTHASFPGELGAFAVFPQHAPLISALVKGEVKYFRNDGIEQSVSVESGFVEVKDDVITVCVE